MLQYILNATSIWLLSLLIYELFLKKESFHGYIRSYLLLTLLLGVFLPLWSWRGDSVIYHTPLSQTVSKAGIVKESITETVAPQHAALNRELIILFIYLCGVTIYLAFIAKEVLQLVIYYKQGIKTRKEKWTIVETGKEHGPFSILQYIFVADKEAYDNDEWQILMEHEQQHGQKLHFADLVLIQLAKAAFWFHPLVYFYENRLLLVHEYQADKAGAAAPHLYGSFLLEQAMLQQAPIIGHSFNRSPVKKRILMLTKKSPRRNLSKLLIAAPLLFCCMLCFTQSSYSYKHDNKGNIVTFHGNKIEFGFGGKSSDMPAVTKNAPASKTVLIKNDGSGAPSGIIMDEKASGPINIEVFSAPLRLNGDTIWSEGDVAVSPVWQGKDKDLTSYIINGVQEQLSLLNDGEYDISISYPVIDKKGRIAYYENKGITARQKTTIIDAAVKQKINERVAYLLDNAPAYKPAVNQGAIVNYYDAWALNMGTHIIVKDHKVSTIYNKPVLLR